MESIDLPNIQSIGPIERSPEQELFSLQAQLQNLQKQLEIDRSYNDDQTVIDTSAKIAEIQRRMKRILQESGRTISIMDRQQIGRTMSDMGERGRTMSNLDRQIERGRTMSNLDRQMMQGMKPNMSNGDEVNVDKLPEGLKAMYESGPKGREGVKNIAAGTDKFAEGDEVMSNNIINDYLEGIAFEMVDKQGNVKNKRNEPIVAYTNALTKIVGPEQAQALINEAVEKKKIENSQKYLDFLSAAPESAKLAEEFKMLQKTRGYAEGDEVNMMLMEMESADDQAMPTEGDIEEGLMELEGMQPEMQMLDQFVGQVIQMIQAGASEEEVIQMLIQAGLDEEDINAIFQSVLEILESPNIDQQLQMLG